MVAASRISIILLLVALGSCVRPSQINEPAHQTATFDFQRFVPISSSTPLYEGVHTANFALDTKTGRMCKTWDWAVLGNSIGELPLCYSIFVTDAAGPQR